VTERLDQIRTHITSVVEIEDVHDHLRRITFGGGDLDTFEPIGPDSFLYVLVPPPGRRDLTIDQSFSWDSYYSMPDDARPVGAYYSVRRWDPDAKRLEMLMVLHGDSGPASAWATDRVAVGDPAALWGPRTAYDPPPDTDRFLLVADETGLPAVAAIIESLPATMPVRVVAEVADEWARQPLPARDGVSVTWLHRDGVEAGTTTMLVDAVEMLSAGLGPRVYAWGGAESRAITAVRKHLRREIGLRREQVSMVGYWRHAAHAADVDDEDG
jgi:NADPH-dependent ferric siderophore reductase